MNAKKDKKNKIQLLLNITWASVTLALLIKVDILLPPYPLRVFAYY